MTVFTRLEQIFSAGRIGKWRDHLIDAKSVSQISKKLIDPIFMAQSDAGCNHTESWLQAVSFEPVQTFYNFGMGPISPVAFAHVIMQIGRSIQAKSHLDTASTEQPAISIVCQQTIGLDEVTADYAGGQFVDSIQRELKKLDTR